MIAAVTVAGIVLFSGLALLLVRTAYWNGFRDGLRTGRAQNTESQRVD